MTGEKNLAKLLASMKPVLRSGEFVFITVEPDKSGALAEPGIGRFLEEEGLTVILPRLAADQAHCRYELPFRMITLTVHSSLAAVGFLAAITARLAQAQISVNPVSAYYHDHLFVPADKAEAALQILTSIAAEAARELV